MKRQEFKTKIWDGITIFLFVLTILCSIISIIMLLSICNYNDSQDSMRQTNYSLFYSLACTFFIAWIMRFYELKKKVDQESVAFISMTPVLNDLICEINCFFPQLKIFATINDNDTIDFPQEIVYYKDIAGTEDNRSFINFLEIFKNEKKSLDQKIKKCFETPMLYQCNVEIINLLTKLYLNGLTLNLFDVYVHITNKLQSNNPCAFGNLFNHFNQQL